MMTVVFAVDPDGMHPREQPDPVRSEDEEENSRDERKELKRLLAILGYRLDQIKQGLDDDFEDILRAARHFFPVFDDMTSPQHEPTRDNRTDEKSIRYGERTKMEELFSGNGYFHTEVSISKKKGSPPFLSASSIGAPDKNVNEKTFVKNVSFLEGAEMTLIQRLSLFKFAP